MGDMGKVLVAYATRGGTARDIADTVGSTLRSAGHEVRVADLKSRPAVDDAELVVLGSGVNACLNAADPAKRAESLAYNASMADRVGAEASESFAGRFVPQHVSWWRRMFLHTMQKPTQDHLDLEAVRAWASTLIHTPAHPAD